MKKTRCGPCGKLFDRNMNTGTDNAEYRTGKSAREVGWQTCPGVLFIGASLRIRIQVMTSFDRTTTRGASKRRAWEAEGWQTRPGVPLIGASLRIRIQVMTSFDRTTTRGAFKRRSWETEALRLHCLHIACWILITTTVRAMTALGTMKKKVLTK
jgi:hypothetical protein